MLECATLTARTSKLDFLLGPALPTTKLSLGNDKFDLVAEAKTPSDERGGFDWGNGDDNTPVARRAGSRSTLAGTGTITSAGAGAGTGNKATPSGLSFGYPVPPSIRLRVAESTPSLSGTPVPESWRTPKDSGRLGVPAGTPSHLAGSPQRIDARRVRRTQSMFPSSQQFMYLEGAAPSPQAAPALASDIPTFSVANDMFPRLDAQTLVRIMDGEFKQHYDRVQVIDCRFEYEYAGGHIAGAQNVSCKNQLEQLLPFDGAKQLRTLFVFHCEYSAYRGPLMATHLRQCDRQANTYPQLTYPNIAVLDGGYSGFFMDNRNRCEPQNYIGMNDTSFSVTCEREMERFRTGMRLAKVSRTSSSFSHLPTKSLDLTHSNISTPSLQRGFVERRPFGPLNF